MFLVMGKQFALTNITRFQTNRHHAMEAIQEDLAINLPMDVNNYQNLKGHTTSIDLKDDQG